ncbi:MAG TPA: hypothetical protein VHE34_09870 [Puia sp.]|uniref:hypothetical protein n=1 Tax=Puia sp. TaxID=2045100 RepID=UPI002CBDC2EB|nr:hypothetical protein [Puia sp.]HVU95522.1 hypothetical protein [Puia sp.]
MIKNAVIAVVSMVTLAFPPHLFAQDSLGAGRKEMEELRLNLNADGTHYLKFTVLGQLWFRYNESNPGTTVLKKPAPHTFDIGIRRIRCQWYGQVTDHAFFYFHFGQDNFNYLSPRKFTPFIQDALAEYRIKKGSEVLIIGGGLSIISGLSRFTQPQLLNILSMDVPIFPFPTFDLTDQFGRKLSAYARGQLGRLDYRLILSDPFPITTAGVANLPTGNPTTPNSNFAQQGNDPQYQALLIWNFFDREPHTTPYLPGTYYGKKKVLNLEVGGLTQKGATWSSPDGGQTVNVHPLNCWSVAVYYDAPVNKRMGTALSAYLGYFDTQYGPGYLRYIGVMNPADGPAASATYIAGGQGNALPMYGTGHVVYSQWGYLLSKGFLGKDNGALEPYGTIQTASYDRLDRQMIVFDLGINWFLSGNKSKLTLDVQNRPTYTLTGNQLIRDAARKSQYVLQYQFFL